MQLIGLAGRAGSGKDTVADYLVDTYGFIKFSFSDALYKEVQEAFGLENQDMLRSRETKEVPQAELALNRCKSSAFFSYTHPHFMNTLHDYGWQTRYRSPRLILQIWGTEFRRAQDPQYWVKKAAAFVEAFKQTPDAHNSAGLVNTSVRFPNEVEYIRSQNGMIWHLHRKGLPEMANATHVSEQPVPFAYGIDKEIHNNSTIERLHTGISLIRGSAGSRIWIEDDSQTVIDYPSAKDPEL